MMDLLLLLGHASVTIQSPFAFVRRIHRRWASDVSIVNILWTRIQPYTSPKCFNLCLSLAGKAMTSLLSFLSASSPLTGFVCAVGLSLAETQLATPGWSGGSLCALANT